MTATPICATPLALAHRAGELPTQPRCVRGLLLVGAALVLGLFS